jgi:hypothetical protein
MARRLVEAALKEGAQKMGAAERKACEAELSEIIESLKPAANVGNKPQDEDVSRPELLQEKGRILGRKRFLEELLNKDDDLKAVSGAERDRLAGRIRVLEDKIKKEMPTDREQAFRSAKDPQDFEAAVRKTVAHQRERGNDIREWQQLKRRLEPDNPMADNVGLLQR